MGCQKETCHPCHGSCTAANGGRAAAWAVAEAQLLHSRLVRVRARTRTRARREEGEKLVVVELVVVVGKEGEALVGKDLGTWSD